MKQYEIVHKVAKAVQEINMNELKQQKKDYNQKLKEIFIESLNSTHNFHVMRDNFKIIESVLQRDVYIISGESISKKKDTGKE